MICLQNVVVVHSSEITLQASTPVARTSSKGDPRAGRWLSGKVRSCWTQRWRFLKPMGVPTIAGWFIIEDPIEIKWMSWGEPHVRTLSELGSSNSSTSISSICFPHWFIHQKWGIYWEYGWSIGHRSPAGVTLGRCHAQAVRGASGAFWSWSFWSLRWDAYWETLGTTVIHDWKKRRWWAYVGHDIDIDLFIYTYPAIRLSIHLPTYLPIYLSTYLPIYLSTCLPIYLSTCLAVCLPVCLSVCLYGWFLVSFSDPEAAGNHVSCRCWAYTYVYGGFHKWGIPKMVGL